MKKKFEKELIHLISAHRNGAKGLRTALALSERIDSIIIDTCQKFFFKEEYPLVVVALGSYGRKELCFKSDIDIMFLTETSDSQIQDIVKRVYQKLADLGVNIGHSFRTIDDCISLVNSDFESWISLLDSRYVYGNKRVFLNYLRCLQSYIRSKDRRFLFDLVIEQIEKRHHKYGDSTKLLEPNIKNSSGGLRDLSSLLWLLKCTGIIKIKDTDESLKSAIQKAFNIQIVEKSIGKKSLKEGIRALNYLLRIRNELHLTVKGTSDTLEFALQQKIAENLSGIRGHKAVERLMREYYINSRIISHLLATAISWLGDKTLSESKSLFLVHPHQLFLKKKKKSLTNEETLKAFLISIQKKAPLSSSLLELIKKNINKYSPLITSTELNVFHRILTQSNGISNSLRVMNDLGLLSKWIPEWEYIVGHFQYNIYHFYTLDEHTLKVISNAEALSESESLYGEIFKELPRTDILFLSCLFHDIGKPKSSDNHEIEGGHIVQNILRRFNYSSEIISDVEFFVTNHLLMERTAFRRNLNDQNTILEFSRKVGTIERLKYLFLLTYSDLKGLNPNVWTQWKEMLLQELYQKTYKVIDNSFSEIHIQQLATERARKTMMRVSRELPDNVTISEAMNHLENISDPTYAELFNVQEIAQHIRELTQNKLVSAIFNHHSHFTEITVIGRDAPATLAKICGTLSANDANIFDANIFTRSDGYLIDKFRVTDFINNGPLSENQCQSIESELLEVFKGTVNPEQLIERHKLKWKRRLPRNNQDIKIDVEFEDHPIYSIIDVFAPDTLGILFRITKTISSLGLNIQFAKIASRADSIVDTFYLLNSDGQKIVSKEDKEKVRISIVNALKQLLGLEQNLD